MTLAFALLVAICAASVGVGDCAKALSSYAGEPLGLSCAALLSPAAAAMSGVVLFHLLLSVGVLPLASASTGASLI